MAQETEDERQARLERIISRLLRSRKEHPLEHRLESQDTVSLASWRSVRAQEDESSVERMNGCTVPKPATVKMRMRSQFRRDEHGNWVRST